MSEHYVASSYTVVDYIEGQTYPTFVMFGQDDISDEVTLVIPKKDWKVMGEPKKLRIALEPVE